MKVIKYTASIFLLGTTAFLTGCQTHITNLKESIETDKSEQHKSPGGRWVSQNSPCYNSGVLDWKLDTYNSKQRKDTKVAFLLPDDAIREFVGPPKEHFAKTSKIAAKAYMYNDKKFKTYRFMGLELGETKKNIIDTYGEIYTIAKTKPTKIVAPKTTPKSWRSP
ncbi:hypothetical protein, partial [Pontibacterium sp.]|uniref:hypothetical protein n=1 Tax=Pontibacterium sp. TaxID=2036026 RepID=UPI003567B1F2